MGSVTDERREEIVHLVFGHPSTISFYSGCYRNTKESFKLLEIPRQCFSKLRDSKKFWRHPWYPSFYFTKSAYFNATRFPMESLSGLSLSYHLSNFI